MFSGFVFLSPYVLLALLALPVLWWLLRLMPPAPRRIELPALFLLQGLSATVTTALRAPWWLLLLRLTMAALFIVALADPVLRPASVLPGAGQGGVVVAVVDDGWASASHWAERQEKMRNVLRGLRADDRAIIFLPTAPSATDGAVRATKPMTAAEAEGWVSRHQPHPWAADYDSVSAVLKDIGEQHDVSHTVFFSDGLSVPQSLLSGVSTVVADTQVNNPYILRYKGVDDSALLFTIERLSPAPVDIFLTLQAWGVDGAVIDSLPVTVPAGHVLMDVSWPLLPELRSKTAKVGVRERDMASAVFLAPSVWRRHPVGIIADGRDDRDFLSEAYYLTRALAGSAPVTTGKADDLVSKNVSALILPDSTPLTAAEKVTLLAWVEKGGVLIRFAGPQLADDTQDALLPVPLRHGLRAMEGAMTWEKPARLAPVTAGSPLYGISVPDDVTVARQVLAEPSPAVFEQTWAQLADGTPLVTAARMGAGYMVLVHTTAGPAWSDLCYSGFYVEALRRMVSLGHAGESYRADAAQPPFLLMDGMGRLSAPARQAGMVSVKPDDVFVPSPRTPPGLYGRADDYTAYNMGDYLPRLQPLADSAVTEAYARAGEVDMQPPLLMAALLLLLVDTLVTLRLRGVMAFVFVLLSWQTPAVAAADAAVSQFHLAYVRTGDAALDRLSQNGLEGLAATLRARTAIDPKGVAGLDLERDDLSLFPIIYWPMTERQPPLSPVAARRVQDYMADGGMIVFDTRAQLFGDAVSTPGLRNLRRLMQGVQMPALTPVSEDHILRRSFYLIDTFPGRYDGGQVWVERAPDPRHDSVTSVVVGGHDWAAAWSRDEGDRVRYVPEPDGARQREMALRFGVNLVMMALTGNYKADQMHVPYILQRIGQ